MGAGLAYLAASRAIRFQRDKWLLDKVADTCVTTIDYLVDGFPPQLVEYTEHGKPIELWDCEDFNGRMASLKHVSARMSILRFFRSQFSLKITKDLEKERKALNEAIEEVRNSTERIYDKDKDGKDKKGLEAGNIQRRIKEAQNAVERYLEEVSEYTGETKTSS